MSPEPAAVVVARATIEVVRAAEALRAAINTAMIAANELSRVVPGWPLLQQAAGVCEAIVDPHGQLRVLAENELSATQAGEAA